MKITMETDGELKEKRFKLGSLRISFFFLENKHLVSFPVKELILGTFKTEAVEMVSELIIRKQPRVSIMHISLSNCT
jgi:hypothetical protein